MSKIITAQELADYMGTGTNIEDKRLNEVVDAVNSFVENYTQRVFGETKQFTEEFDFEGVIFLSHPDIVSVESVEVGGAKLDNVKVNKQTGRVTIAQPRTSHSVATYDQIVVTYEAGLLEVPADLKLATLQLASNEFTKRDGANANITSESVGAYSVSFGSIDTTGSEGRGNSAMGVLRSYQVRSL